MKLVKAVAIGVCVIWFTCGALYALARLVSYVLETFGMQGAVGLILSAVGGLVGLALWAGDE